MKSPRELTVDFRASLLAPVVITSLTTLKKREKLSESTLIAPEDTARSARFLYILMTSVIPSRKPLLIPSLPTSTIERRNLRYSLPASPKNLPIEDPVVLKKSSIDLDNSLMLLMKPLPLKPLDNS